ncbi:MAG: PLP-dependent transferase [Candidatus Aminicenantes bacterium]|nr:PLP-dependent transferase [Candidatus Aminicenantes bacterium]
MPESNAYRNMFTLFTLNDIRTLRSKMDFLSQNCQKVSKFISHHPRVYQVDYLGLQSSCLHELAKKYMKLVDSDDGNGNEINRYGHLMSFRVDGPPENARKVFDNLKLIFRATDLGRIKSLATIPAISTHKQQGKEARRMADIPPQMIRLCVGGENPDDIIGDLDQALRSLYRYNIFGPVRPWNREGDNTGESLRTAMDQNPYLHVMIQSGYFDGGTDYFSAKYTMWNLDPSGKLKGRFRFEGYRSGHMMYLRDEDLPLSNEHIREFIRQALAAAEKPAGY